MKQRRIRLRRCQGIKQRFELFVLDVDQLQRRFRDFLAFGCHRRYFFTDEAHDAFSKNRHVVDFAADQPTFNVFAGGDGSDAGQRRGAVCIDFLDAPISNRAAEDFGPKHVGQHDIRRIDGPPRNFVRPLQAVGSDDR